MGHDVGRKGSRGFNNKHMNYSSALIDVYDVRNELLGPSSPSGTLHSPIGKLTPSAAPPTIILQNVPLPSANQTCIQKDD